MPDLSVIKSEDVLEALRLWHGGNPSEWPLDHLRLNRDVRHEQENKEDNGDRLAGGGPVRQNRAILEQGLTLLKGASPEAHDLLRDRFEHRREVLAVANSLNLSEAALHYRQRQAIKQLTDILITLEEETGREWQDRMLARLDLPSYDRLVGIEEPRAKLIGALMDTGSFYITALDGIGGIGKTALADHIVRELIQTTRFDEIAWVTAKQTHLSTRGRLQIESGRPALTFPMLMNELVTQFEVPDSSAGSQLKRQRRVKRWLRERPCLVVIDNLETVADYRTLLPELRQWQNPSKFLITSRRRLLDEPGVFSISLEELPPAGAFELIRLEARHAGFSALEEADDKELQKIYDVVGGNPLALKLLVGQLRFHDLPHVLARFSGQNTQPNEGLFNYIYREVWETVNDAAKETLLALTQAGESGFTFTHLMELVALSEAELTRALEELVLLAVVDVGGNLLEKRYRLHRLTEVFLLRMFDEA